RADIFDDTNCKDITATFELPGVAVRGINVDILDGILVEGNPQTKDNHIQTGEPVLCIIIAALRYGKFRRDNNIQLLNGVQVNSDVTASLQNGMVKVTWPRQP
ncbi:hypothetical protein L218DRAFT_846882, partial [Marasmius fiardii PR-910]